MTASPGVATDTGTPLRIRVAEEIRVELTRKRMSAARLARELGVSQTYVWRRLNGETAFDLDDLERIASVLGVSVFSLLPNSLSQPMAQHAGNGSAPTNQTLIRDHGPFGPARPGDGRPNGHPGSAHPDVRRTSRTGKGPNWPIPQQQQATAGSRPWQPMT